MANLNNVVRQLRSKRQQTQEQVERIDQVISALEGLTGRDGFRSSPGRPRQMSAAARQRIAAAQKALWAKWHRQRGAKANGKAPAKRVFSAATRRKMAAAQRARWSKKAA